MPGLLFSNCTDTKNDMTSIQSICLNFFFFTQNEKITEIRDDMSFEN